jgi:hypothetical protein
MMTKVELSNIAFAASAMRAAKNKKHCRGLIKEYLKQGSPEYLRIVKQIMKEDYKGIYE